MTYSEKQYYNYWRDAETDNEQLRAVCRYLRGEVERLERELRLA